MDTVENKNIPVEKETKAKLSPLDQLKQKADTLGIVYNPRIGISKLRDKVDQFLAEAEESAALRETAPEAVSEKIIRKRRESAELIRVRVNCLNPAKRNWLGEIISVGNGKIGTFKKYIPFNITAGYHIPKIIYNYLLTRQYQSFYTVKGKEGRPDEKRSRLVREFNIEVLPNLTEKELATLAEEQALNHSLDE